MKKLALTLLLTVVTVSLFGYITLRHFVQYSDTLSSICTKYKIDSSVILDWNPEVTPEKLNVGGVIKIPFPIGYRYQVNPEDTLSTIANFFFANVESIALANDMEKPYGVRTGDYLFIPEYSIGETFNDVPGKLLWPAYGIITSPYGYRTHPVTGQKKSFHSGIDIAREASGLKEDTPYGAPIFAAESGTVTFAGENGGYGNMIEIKGNAYIFRYGHMTRFAVYEGQHVKKGQILGRMGNTGRSTGQHLHFEVRTPDNTQTLDPMDFLPPVSEMKK
ncbi:MAG: LysM peptidoglycan-binding domain-containing M23 family metallopeptidase [Thermotogota bacterium]